MRECFVNFIGGKTVIPNPIDVMHAKNKILPLYEICRLHLGINRDTAAAFLSYCNMKAYYHKFQSTGSSERWLSVSQVDEGVEVTIYVKTGGYFYCSTNCPVPDKHVESVKNSSEDKKEAVPNTTRKKRTKWRSKAFSKKEKQTKTGKIISWQGFDSKSLVALGKRIAEQKSGYEFGPQYDFREYFWQRDWDKIVSRSLALSPENDKSLVPFKQNISDGGDKSDTEAYSEDDK